METTKYGKSWFRARREIIEPWDAVRARQAHETRQRYVAVLFRDTSPKTVVELNADSINVEFLDAGGRSYRSFQFQEQMPGQLFLTLATNREFEGDTDRVQSGNTQYFEPSGRVVMESEDFRTGETTTQESLSDVTSNWEDYPVFGQLDSITRAER